MDQGSKERGSPVTAPQTLGGIATAPRLRFAAHGVNSPPATTACLGAVQPATSGVGSRPVLKAFGPVQQHGSCNSGAGCRLASGLPTRRRLLGRRQQQQQQQAQDQNGVAANTAHGCVAGSRSADSSTRRSSPRKSRPTIKEFLGVNPADILMPLLSPPKKTADKHKTQNATRGASSSEGVSPLAFFSTQHLPRQEIQQHKHSVRQKPSVLPGFLARLLPLGGDEGTSAGETAADIKENAKEHQKQQQEEDIRLHAAAAAQASPSLAEETILSPPGIIVRPNAPLVPAFNASEGEQPVWKPIVYESKPIYLLPNGSTTNAASNTQATINTASFRNGTQTVGTVPGCTVTTAASCVLPAAMVPGAGSAPPTVAGGHALMQVPPGLSFRLTPASVKETGSRPLQSPTPLTASSLLGEDDSSDQNGVPLTNYQKYLKWKEQQRRQQLLYQQLRLQQQQHIAAQWIKTIENLIPQAQPRGSCGPSTNNGAQKLVTRASELAQQCQEQPFYLQQQQLQQPFNSQQQPFDPQQQPFDLLVQQQQQPFDAQQRLMNPQHQRLDSQQQPVDPHGGQQLQTFDPHQRLQVLNAQQQQQQAPDQQGLTCGQEQQQQEYDERQQFHSLRLQNVAAVVGQEEQEANDSGWVNQPQRQAFEQQRGFPQEGRLREDDWQEPQQWEELQNGLQQHSQGEGCYGEDASSSLQQLYFNSQTAENGYLPQTAFSQYPAGIRIHGPVEAQPVSPGISWMPAGREVWNSNARNNVDEEAAGPAGVAAATLEEQHLLQRGQVNPVPNFFPQPAYSTQPPSFAHAMTPVAGAPFHPGFNYAEGISVHYNYYDAEEWTAKLQAAATQRGYSGSTQEGAEQEAPRDTSGASFSVNCEGGEENAADWGLKPLLTSKQRLPSGQVFVP